MNTIKLYLKFSTPIYILFIWVLLVLFSVSVAQTNELIYKQITTKNGLQDDVTISIVQDEQGIMWFGTRSGLVRYDGINLKTFSYDPDIPDGLSGNNIVGLHVDENGLLWIGTINGLFSFDTKLDRPVNIHIKVDEQTISPKIQYITSSKDGLIWIGTLANGLISYNPQNNISIQYIDTKNEKNSILDNRISSIVCTEDDKLWIGTGKGLNCYDQKTKTFTSFKHEKGNPNTISGDIITSLALGDNSDLWIGTLNSGLNRMNLESGEIKIYKHEENNKNSISDNLISAIMFDNNVVWLGSGRGIEPINRLDPKTDLISRFKIGEISFGTVSRGSVNDLFKDRTGTIWIAQGLGGINYFDLSWKNYDHYIIGSNRKENMTNRIYGINPISNTELWASTFGGLVLFDLKKGIVKNITEKNKLWLLNNNSIEVKNELWIPSRNKGIVRYNLKSEIISYFVHDPKNNESISSNYVNILLKDKKGIIWAGSRDGGLDRIDPMTNRVKRYNHIPGKPKSLPENSIYALLEENEKQLWVGTNGGLALFDKKSEVFKNYPYNPNDTNSISSDQISYILKSKSGVLWVSTYGGGLNRFDAENQTFKRYTSQKNNIPDNTIYSTLEDENGKIWVSTAAGIARFSPENETYDYLIDKPDYYKATKFANGKFAFSGPRGLLVFDPNKMKFNSLPPIISLSEFTVNGQPKVSDSKVPYKYYLNTDKRIELDYFQNDIGFEFTAAHYSDAGKNRYKVYLEGYDKKWRSLGTNRKTNYTNIDPGEYTLKIKASSAYDIWTDKPLKFLITVKHPWWKTWWAYLGYFLMIFTFLYFTRRFELHRREEKENKRLLELENKRKSEELEEARQLQLSMLPKELPQLANLDIAVYMQTATEVGGDYYDFHIGMDGTLTVVVGDATGHGMKAGTMVTAAKSLFNVLAPNPNIVETFHEMTRCLKLMQMQKLSMCMTMIKIMGNKIQMSAAGMPPVFICKKESQTIEEHVMKGMPLGTFSDFPYTLIESKLSTGDTILMMSDGFPELMNNNKEMFGYKQARNLFEEISGESPEEIITKLKNAGSEWTNDADPDDDVTFVVIKVK